MENEAPIVVSSECSVLLERDVYTAMFVTCPASLGHVPLGNVEIRWKRAPDENEKLEDEEISEEELAVSFVSTLPQLDIQQPNFLVDINSASSCILGTTFQLKINIKNTTTSRQEVAFSLAPSENIQCLLSGRTQGIISILPESIHELVFNVVPLLTGHVRIPQLLLTSMRYEKSLCDAESFGYIYVEPEKWITGLEDLGSFVCSVFSIFVSTVKFHTIKKEKVPN
eukprot:TRINITY_DN8082_c0_g1_i1.p1 TRINITY_DN8082_c0_g1~~TRINITY_DN8082_c0_g1_i1.p1  ORF type:complete len:226 (+),score=27.68 TRINITY_DN8082_c0_g1_i1:361-1038(+)